jgi:hypothetical protein
MDKRLLLARESGTRLCIVEDDVVPRINYFNALQFLIPLGKSQ